jgi:hypothetical protein
VLTVVGSVGDKQAFDPAGPAMGRSTRLLDDRQPALVSKVPRRFGHAVDLATSDATVRKWFGKWVPLAITQEMTTLSSEVAV